MHRAHTGLFAPRQPQALGASISFLLVWSDRVGTGFIETPFPLEGTVCYLSSMISFSHRSRGYYDLRPEELAPVLRQLRSERGWTLTEASEALGVARSPLYRAEKDSETHFRFAIKVLRAYAEHEDSNPSRSSNVVPRVRVSPFFGSAVDGVREPRRAPLREAVEAAFRGHDFVIDTAGPALAIPRQGENEVVFYLDEGKAVIRGFGLRYGPRSVFVRDGDEPESEFAKRVLNAVTRAPP